MDRAPLTLPFGLLVLTVALSIAATAATYRFLQRRQRRSARRDEQSFAQALRDHLDDRLAAGVLRARAATADAGAFWTVIESRALRVGRAEWRQVAAALRGARHVVDERRALRDESPWRRTLAARRLALLPSPAARRALRRALVRGPEEVALAAALALGRHRDGAALAWCLAHPDALANRTPAALVALLRAYGRRGLPRIAAALANRLRGTRLERAAIEVLGHGRHRAARPVLERCLGSRDVEVRIAAARALGRLAAVEAASSLLGALKDDAWQVRAQSARALGLARAPIAVEPLARRLTDPSWWVRRHAAYALVELGEDGRRALREVERVSPDPYARDIAREALDGGFERESA